MFWFRYAGLVLLVHGALFLDLPSVWHAGATLILTGLAPGLLLVELLVGRRSGALFSGPLPWYERLLYAAGAGYGCMVVGMLLLNFLPGPLTSLRVLAFFDGLLLVLASLLWLRPRLSAEHRLSTEPIQENIEERTVFQQGLHAASTGPGLLWIGLLLLVLVGGTLRFFHLGYAEFQGDEARPLLRAVETLRGDAQAIYSHQKGPAEILIPALVYALGDRLNEAAARLPFAVAGFTGLLGVFLLGWRMFHPVAGWVAAMLLALDGYLIGFARIVQYQSLVFLMMVLCLLIFYRLVQLSSSQRLHHSLDHDLHPGLHQGTRYLVLAALFLATGLLAHYEAALIVLPGLYLLLASRFWVRSQSVARDWGWGIPQPLRLLRALIAPMGVGALLLGLFYVPFVLAPTFDTTYAYIAESRIGGAFPYNNLADFFRRTTLYSTSYTIGLLTLCALVGLVTVYRRTLPGVWAWLMTAWVAGGLVAAIWVQSQSPAPFFARTELHDPTWLLFVGAFGLAWFAPGLAAGERAVWIWLGAAMILMLFFTFTPNTHVYGFIIPWTLVAGMVVARGWGALHRRLGFSPAARVAIPLAALFIVLVGNFAYGYFADATRERLFTWRENRLPGYWVPFEMPDRARFSSFGFPMRNGWKAIGVLYGAGREGCAHVDARNAPDVDPDVGPDEGPDCLRLHAPFDTNDRQAVADWYTRGAYCPRDHRYFMLSHPVEPGEQENVAQLRADLLAQDYVPIGVVQVAGRDKIEIYDREAEHRPGARHALDVEDYIAMFDRVFSGPRFVLNGPLVDPAPQHTLDYRFGEHIRLAGYDLARVESQALGDPVSEQTEVQAGVQTEGQYALVLTLYWRTEEPLDTPYTVFNQVLRMDDFHNIGQRDGEPGCNQFPTDGWTPHTTYADRYYIPLASGADPGIYSLLHGLYDRETGDRLPIFAPNGDFIGDAVELAEIELDR